MTDEITDAILMVRVAKAAGTEFGTAWVCGDGLAMTAWHVVHSAGSILLISSAGGESPASCIDKDEALDVALLRFSRRTRPCPGAAAISMTVSSN